MPLANDARNAWRQVQKERTFTIIVIITLALSIGAATTIFGLFDAVFLRPFPYENPDALVRMRTYEPAVPGSTREASLDDFNDWRANSRSFSELAEYWTYGNVLTNHGPARLVRMTFASRTVSRATGQAVDRPQFHGRRKSTSRRRAQGSSQLRTLERALRRQRRCPRPANSHAWPDLHGHRSNARWLFVSRWHGHLDPHDGEIFHIRRSVVEEARCPHPQRYRKAAGRRIAKAGASRHERGCGQLEATVSRYEPGDSHSGFFTSRRRNGTRATVRDDGQHSCSPIATDRMR